MVLAQRKLFRISLRDIKMVAAIFATLLILSWCGKCRFENEYLRFNVLKSNFRQSGYPFSTKFDNEKIVRNETELVKKYSLE